MSVLSALALEHWNVYDDRWVVVKSMLPRGVTDD